TQASPTRSKTYARSSPPTTRWSSVIAIDLPTGSPLPGSMISPAAPNGAPTVTVNFRVVWPLESSAATVTVVSPVVVLLGVIDRVRELPEPEKLMPASGTTESLALSALSVSVPGVSLAMASWTSTTSPSVVATSATGPMTGPPAGPPELQATRREGARSAAARSEGRRSHRRCAMPAPPSGSRYPRDGLTSESYPPEGASVQPSSP